MSIDRHQMTQTDAQEIADVMYFVFECQDCNRKIQMGSDGSIIIIEQGEFTTPHYTIGNQSGVILSVGTTTFIAGSEDDLPQD